MQVVFLLTALNSKSPKLVPLKNVQLIDLKLNTIKMGAITMYANYTYFYTSTSALNSLFGPYGRELKNVAFGHSGLPILLIIGPLLYLWCPPQSSSIERWITQRIYSLTALSYFLSLFFFYLFIYWLNCIYKLYVNYI